MRRANNENTHVAVNTSVAHLFIIRVYDIYTYTFHTRTSPQHYGLVIQCCLCTVRCRCCVTKGKKSSLGPDVGLFYDPCKVCVRNRVQKRKQSAGNNVYTHTRTYIFLCIHYGVAHARPHRPTYARACVQNDSCNDFTPIFSGSIFVIIFFKIFTYFCKIIKPHLMIFETVSVDFDFVFLCEYVFGQFHVSRMYYPQFTTGTW